MEAISWISIGCVVSLIVIAFLMARSHQTQHFQVYGYPGEEEQNEVNS